MSVPCFHGYNLLTVCPSLTPSLYLELPALSLPLTDYTLRGVNSACGQPAAWTLALGFPLQWLCLFTPCSGSFKRPAVAPDWKPPGGLDGKAALLFVWVVKTHSLITRQPDTAESPAGLGLDPGYFFNQQCGIFSFISETGVYEVTLGVLRLRKEMCKVHGPCIMCEVLHKWQSSGGSCIQNPPPLLSAQLRQSAGCVP